MTKNIHLIYGADEFWVDLKAKKVIKTFEGFAIETIDGGMANNAELDSVLSNTIESLQTIDFFSLRKCVWLRSTNLLSTGSPATTETAQLIVEKWIKVLENLPKDVQLVISASPVDKRIRLFKLLQCLAVCEELEEKKADNYLVFLIKKLCQEQQMDITTQAVECLKQKLNYQPRSIASEFEKLACLKNFTGTITEEDVLKYTPTLLNDEFFEPVEAFYAQDEKRYVRSLRNHFVLNKEMRSVLLMMQNRNRLFIQLKALQLNVVNKTNLDARYKDYSRYFGPIEEKNAFCIFSQNPWYLSRLQTKFSLDTLLALQLEMVHIFDQILQHPRQSCAWMEALVRFF